MVPVKELAEVEAEEAVELAAVVERGGGGGYDILGKGGLGNSGGLNASSNIINSLGTPGGGGAGGNSGKRASGSVVGTGGAVSNGIFSSNYCNGGNGAGDYSNGDNGKQGAMRIQWPKTANALRCQYKDVSNSGGGGGAGQIWIGEITVTPGQKINFNIGLGGARTTAYSKDGNDGGTTSITINGSTVASVLGGKGGKYESNDSNISNSGGKGGGINKTSFSSIAVYNDWAGLNLETGGTDGFSGNVVSNGSGGGKGGDSKKQDGTLLSGGNPGGASSNGSDASSSNYGAGGGGGGGVVTYGSNPGFGGKGANGYIYFEWGSANGGGGAAGQIVNKKDIWVSAGTKVKINIGKGGEGKPILNTLNGASGYFGQKGNDGGDTYVTTTEGEAIRAKGGIGGGAAGANHGLGGNSDESMKNSVKGEPGNDDYGGIGGTITPEISPLFDTLMGLGGCGGNMPNGNCANSSSTAIGKNAAKVGGGGGGGAVKENAAYKGGRGGNGMVVIEWSN